MVWKLKKSQPSEADEKAETTARVAADDSIIIGAPLSEPDFKPESESDDFLAGRLTDVDETVAALSRAQNPPDPSAEAHAGETSDGEDDWSLDAFAPYNPSGNGAAAHTIDLDAFSNGEATFTPVSGDTRIEPIDLGESPLTATESGFGDDTDFEQVIGNGSEAPHFEDAEEPVAASSPPDELEPIVFEEPLDSKKTNGSKPIALGSAPDVFDENATLAQVPVDVTPVPKQTKKPAKPTVQLEETAAAPPPQAPHLIVRLGAFAATYPLTTADMVIGRPDPNSGSVPDITIEWDDAISRRHAHVVSQGDNYYVADLGSKNGTYLNGRQLPPDTPVALSSGDSIRVGEKTEITFMS